MINERMDWSAMYNSTLPFYRINFNGLYINNKKNYLDTTLLYIYIEDDIH